MNEEAEVITRKTATGWDVTVRHAEKVVVRTQGERITVAVTPDDDATTPVPLEVELGQVG